MSKELLDYWRERSKAAKDDEVNHAYCNRDRMDETIAALEAADQELATARQHAMNNSATAWELSQEIARVQSLHEGLMKNADKMNDELRAEIAALKADAGRYRWLRVYPNHYFPEEEQIHGALIDSAIDAILREEEQTP